MAMKSVTAYRVVVAWFHRMVAPRHLRNWAFVGYCYDENLKKGVTEMSSDLEEEAGEIRLEERLAAPMAVALARLLGEAEEASAGPCRQRTILDVARQLSQIGRESLPGEWVRMERERREEKLSEICQKERQEAGAGEARDLSGTLINLAESRRIKPNQTCWRVCPPTPYVGGYARRCCGGGTFCVLSGLFPWYCENQAGSR